jgi:hypothetical protein
MQIDKYHSVTGDGRLIILNGAFTPDELREVLNNAAEPREPDIDDDDLLA